MKAHSGRIEKKSINGIANTGTDIYHFLSGNKNEENWNFPPVSIWWQVTRRQENASYLNMGSPQYPVLEATGLNLDTISHVITRIINIIIIIFFYWSLIADTGTHDFLSNTKSWCGEIHIKNQSELEDVQLFNHELNPVKFDSWKQEVVL